MKEKKPPFKKKFKASYPKRGEVYWVKLGGQGLGSEMAKSRPAVVVSKDFCNKNLGRVTVVPITSAKAGPEDRVHENEVRTTIPNNQGKVVHGKALADQITTIDHQKLSSKICTLSQDTMTRVQEALKKFFEIEV